MKILEKISGFLFLIFFTVLTFGVFISLTDFKIRMELPINDFAGFVVDQNENIYIGDNFYSIIQKYNKKGQFIESIRVKNTRGKFFRMGIDSKDNIIVNSQVDKNSIIYPHYNRDNIFIVYNNNKSEKLKGVNKIFITLKNQKFEDLGTFYSSIWRLTETKQKIIEQNFLLKFLSLPTMIMIVAIALIMKLFLFILKKLEK